MFSLGFLINPLAGLGGSVALKGSDGVAAQALALGAVAQAPARAAAVLQALLPWREQIRIVTAAGEMGGDVAQRLGFATQRVHVPAAATSAGDTITTAQALRAARVDLLLFAGGDGTARDVCSAVGLALPVLGIPAGVKMHSGVFAVTPQAAAEIVQLMLAGELVSIDSAEVRDIDEAALRAGRVQSRHFGEMRVPSDGRYLQQVKCSGVEVEALLLQEIAAAVVENLDAGVTYFIAPGTTTAAVMAALALPNTLLGVDVIRDGQLLAADADAAVLEHFAEAGPCRLIITATGGQGILLGRGNQQISAKVLQAIGREGLIVIATEAKLKALAGRPLLMDVPDAAVAEALAGFVEVITGYQSRVLYRLATHA
ncbi:MAG: ATP-NAD kinase family protein [bacterium]|nr:ATP-NAD kinase family protein [bacterium]